jgi:hypothetical protein
MLQFQRVIHHQGSEGIPSDDGVNGFIHLLLNLLLGEQPLHIFFVHLP